MQIDKKKKYNLKINKSIRVNILNNNRLLMFHCGVPLTLFYISMPAAIGRGSSQFFPSTPSRVVNKIKFITDLGLINKL